MKLSAYRTALIRLAEQALADYQLQIMLTPTSTESVYFGKDLIKFTEALNSIIDEPEVLKAASISGPPIPEFVNLATLPGTNVFAGTPNAPPLAGSDAMLNKEGKPDEVTQTQTSQDAALDCLKNIKPQDLTKTQLVTLLTHVLNALKTEK